MAGLDELTEELKDILEEAEATTLLEIINKLQQQEEVKVEKLKRKDNCWIDGRKCPYGSPEGKLILASVKWCVGCHAFIDYRETYSFQKLIEDPLETEEIMKTKEEIEGELETIEDLLEDLAAKNNSDCPIIKDFIRVISDRLDLAEIQIVRQDNLPF